ncbi:hypothetical protein P170DRAFT_422458 [Aspergillus steynii IBT 23096]|uniref:Celp0028 effector like protein n=1 Tax=Aspergillus steynii IBT 23096 TaxID=1392250 RepID=A0A2I2GEY1_9EURO|nr:uncharacterized protein P170DRAFT_422458 [Aspergillus steynii IBT 23096]PLB51444.1 hypothetical protein P170DRAFT_422458 [Aspergillus steynii IBT 23096]
MKAAFTLFASLCAVTTALPHDQATNPQDSGLDKATLLLHDGSTVSIDKKDLSAHLNGAALSPPVNDLPRRLTSSPTTHLTKRGSDAQLIIPLPDQEFLGWDIPMSTITHANEADATVAMSAGNTIANSITVGSSFAASVESFLTVTTHIDYGYTETSALTGTVTMTIPKNKWGAIVSNPLTQRKRGYVFNGQPGSGSFEYFQADSFNSETYTYGQNSLSWVKGVMTTCLGDSYPLKMCNGDGELK